MPIKPQSLKPKYTGKRSITQNSLHIAIWEKKMFTKMPLFVLTMNLAWSMANIPRKTQLENTNSSFASSCWLQIAAWLGVEVHAHFWLSKLGPRLTWTSAGPACATTYSLCEIMCKSVTLCLEDSFLPYLQFLTLFLILFHIGHWTLSSFDEGNNFRISVSKSLSPHSVKLWIFVLVLVHFRIMAKIFIW